MLPTVHIRQDVLSRWRGKVDATDALIVTALRSLNADNPMVKAAMWNGHYLFCRAFILEMLPLLNISEDRISRRLKRLKDLGLVDLDHRITFKGRLLYAKLSRLYWLAEEKANQKANSHAVKIPHGENPTGYSARMQPATAPQDHIDDQEEVHAAAPASAGPSAGPPPPASPEPLKQGDPVTALAVVVPGEKPPILGSLLTDLALEYAKKSRDPEMEKRVRRRAGQV